MKTEFREARSAPFAPQRILLGFLVFSAIAVLVSQWLGLAWRNTPAILAISVALTWLCLKAFPVDLKNFTVPKSVWLLALLVFIMASYPLLTITPFYAPSADALHSITLRVLEGNIPATYAPYSDFGFHYQFGFHLFARLFADLLPFIPDYLVLWFLGALFAGIQAIVFFWLGKKFLKSESAGFWCALLFVGTRLVFQNMYFGLYPMIFGTALFLLAATLFLERNPLWAILFASVLAIHAGSAFNMVLFFALLLVFFAREHARFFAKWIWLALLALPSLIIVYPSLVSHPFAASATSLSGLLEEMLYVFPLWVGAIPMLFLVIAILISWREKSFFKEKSFAIALTIISFGLFLYFAFTGSQLFGKIVELMSFAAILFAASTLSQKRRPLLETRFARITIVALCLAFFLSSGYLNSLRSGDNFSIGEAKFAFAFNSLDPTPQKTLFLSEHGGKIAEYANKIPYDAMRDYFLPYQPNQIRDGNDYAMLVSRKSEQEKIISENCTECIYDLNVRYVAVDTNFTSLRLNEKSVFATGNFILYDLGAKK
ncbi:MAG: hypothetical protein WC602_02870 [archaeon]